MPLGSFGFTQERLRLTSTFFVYLMTTLTFFRMTSNCFDYLRNTFRYLCSPSKRLWVPRYQITSTFFRLYVVFFIFVNFVAIRVTSPYSGTIVPYPYSGLLKSIRNLLLKRIPCTRKPFSNSKNQLHKVNPANMKFIQQNRIQSRSPKIAEKPFLLTQNHSSASQCHNLLGLYIGLFYIVCQKIVAFH